jgi:hypothetical protein
MDGRRLLDSLASARLNGAPVTAARSEWPSATLQEIDRLFDALLGPADTAQASRLDSLRGLLDGDSAYQIYPRADFPQLNRLRELLLGLP